jgi:hypothetical protein
MDGIKPINRIQVNEHDGAVPIRYHRLQFRKREGVFGCFDKSQCACSIDSHQGIGAIRGAITAGTQFTF